MTSCRCGCTGSRPCAAPSTASTRRTSSSTRAGSVISISTATATAAPDPETGRRIALKVYGTSGWDPDAFLMPGVDLMFDTIAYKNFPVVVLNLNAPSALLGFQLGGIIGHRFLSQTASGSIERSAPKNVSNVMADGYV